MTKIRVSYQKPQELDTVVKLLKPVLVSYKVSKNDVGSYKKAYIEVNYSMDSSDKNAV